MIDCSWAHFDEITYRAVKSNERLLPTLLASNPVNFGKPIKLNCAEALSACLELAGM